jgi:Ion channel
MLLLLFLLTLLLFVVTILMHYECLRLISSLLAVLDGILRRKLLLVIFGVLIAHIFEIAFYGGGYWFAENVLRAGDFSDAHILRLADYFYFSAETFTSLGAGDLLPLGNMRMLAGMETLNGLLLIGWSTSYTFVAMTRFWTLE